MDPEVAAETSDNALPVDPQERPHIIIEYQLQPPTRDEGGFINKKTGIHYLNATTQTDPKPQPPKPPKFTRDAQTVHLSAHTSQTKRESGTQMVFSPYILLWIMLFASPCSLNRGLR
jgi:hypothetical protein